MATGTVPSTGGELTMNRANKTQLVCDTCGEPIKRHKEGLVEFVRLGGDDDRQTARIVHQGACVYAPGATVAQIGGGYRFYRLDNFVGPDGLTVLLDMLAEDDATFERDAVVEL